MHGRLVHPQLPTQLRADVLPRRQWFGPCGRPGRLQCAAQTGAGAAPRLGWKRNFQEQFELEETFSEGAFASLNRAINKETGEEVAVKVISKHGSRSTPGSHAR